MIANVTLSTKERFLLEDQKTHEEQCILKYDNYANLACDEQLKSVFRSNGQKEQEHLQTINQLLNGKIPSMAGQSQSGGQSQGQSQSGGQSQAGSQGQMGGQSQQNSQSAMGGQLKMGGLGQSSQGITSQQSSIEKSGSQGIKMSDKDMCTDMLSTEKYVSGTYDTAIFEFSSAQVRDVLNHIQKEEQKHGEAIFSYMQSKGMYSPQ